MSARAATQAPDSVAGEVDALCPGHPVGPHDTVTIDQALDLIRAVPGWGTAGDTSQAQRLRGARALLTWLAGYPGEGWQQRWAVAGGNDEDHDWLNIRADDDRRDPATVRQDIQAGANWLFLARIIQPGYAVFAGRKAYLFTRLLPTVRSSQVFERVFGSEEAIRLGAAEQLQRARAALVKIMLHTGKGLDEIDGDDLLEFRRWQLAYPRREGRRGGKQLALAWALLVEGGILPAGSTLRAAVRTGQRSIAELVDYYDVRDPTIRDVLVRYCSERAPALDYNSQRHLVHILARPACSGPILKRTTRVSTHSSYRSRWLWPGSNASPTSTVQGWPLSARPTSTR